MSIRALDVRPVAGNRVEVLVDALIEADLGLMHLRRTALEGVPIRGSIVCSDQGTLRTLHGSYLLKLTEASADGVQWNLIARSGQAVERRPR
jgi:hypothetical protein